MYVIQGRVITLWNIWIIVNRTIQSNSSRFYFIKHPLRTTFLGKFDFHVEHEVTQVVENSRNGNGNDVNPVINLNGVDLFQRDDSRMFYKLTKTYVQDSQQYLMSVQWTVKQTKMDI